MISFEALIGIGVSMIIVYIYFKEKSKTSLKKKEGFGGDKSSLPPSACGAAPTNCSAPGYCQYSTKGPPGGDDAADSAFSGKTPCHSDADCMGQGSCIGGEETSKNYCPKFAGFPYLLKNCQEGAWYFRWCLRADL